MLYIFLRLFSLDRKQGEMEQTGDQKNRVNFPNLKWYKGSVIWKHSIYNEKEKKVKKNERNEKFDDANQVQRSCNNSESTMRLPNFVISECTSTRLHHEYVKRLYGGTLVYPQNSPYSLSFSLSLFIHLPIPLFIYVSAYPFSSPYLKLFIIAERSTHIISSYVNT